MYHLSVDLDMQKRNPIYGAGAASCGIQGCIVAIRPLRAGNDPNTAGWLGRASQVNPSAQPRLTWTGGAAVAIVTSSLGKPMFRTLMPSRWIST
uniref:Uncharacterized protein n=1 Tax=Pyricularia oryzae (strain P131) TaxID=1143193 RepID=L7IYJ0_PYRO1